MKSGTKGIHIWFGKNRPPRLKPSRNANQKKPRRFYVYGHFDGKGTPFYIGKGTKGRAWETDRHYFWHRFVDKHLGGEYTVIILEDNLSSDEAEELESQWVAQESSTLVNWINYGRETDFNALDRFHQLRNRNRDLASKARELEKLDIQKAISLYLKAYEAIERYAFIQEEKGFLGQLIDEDREENGIQGDIMVLDRLTLCLCKAKRLEETVSITEDYFKKYRADLKLKIAERILKRIEKVKEK